MNIFIHVSWHVKIHHQLDIGQVESSTQYACTNHHFKLALKQTLKNNMHRGKSLSLIKSANILSVSHLSKMITLRIRLRSHCVLSE